jgi:hypothetical protein
MSATTPNPEGDKPTPSGFDAAVQFIVLVVSIISILYGIKAFMH